MKNNQIRFYTHKKPINLSRLLLASAYGFILRKFLKKSSYFLPEKIGDYDYYKTPIVNGEINNFLIGIYKHRKTKKKVFVKVWNGKMKDFRYYTMQNEIILLQILRNVHKRIKKTLPDSLKNIHIPELIDVIYEKEKVFMLVEYLEGKDAEYLSSKEKTYLFHMSADFLKLLGSNLNSEEKLFISKRTALQNIILYPFLLIKALAMYPQYAKDLLKGLLILITKISFLLENEDEQLSHRDLHYRNIFISHGKIYLTDLELAAFTDTTQDFATSLRMGWSEGKLSRKLLAEAYMRSNNKSLYLNKLQLTIICSATHGLTGRFSEKTILKWVDFLKFGISLSSKTKTESSTSLKRKSKPIFNVFSNTIIENRS